MAALIKRQRPEHYTIVGVLVSRAGQPAAEVARRQGIEVIEAPPGFAKLPAEARDRFLKKAVEHWKADWICLAGFLIIVGKDLVQAYPWRILNIHPSLLPKFPGLHAQRQALEARATVSGVTVHFVDEDVDHGPIVVQREVSINEKDSEETLSARILKVEHEIYSFALEEIFTRGCRIVDRKVEFL